MGDYRTQPDPVPSGCCGIGSGGVPSPSLADYVTVMNPRIGRPPPEGVRVAYALETNGRHDPCVGIRATPIAEAMMALVLMDHALLHRAQNTDVSTKTPKIAASLKQAASAGEKKSSTKINPDPAEAWRHFHGKPHALG